METFGDIFNKAITSSWKDVLDFLSDEHMAFNLTSHFHLTVPRGDNKGHRLVAPSGYAIKKNSPGGHRIKMKYIISQS